MLRQKVGEGERQRYERVLPGHSWNSNNIATNVLLYHLQRHSDHHANPTRRYQTLRDFEESPVLPTGYAGMIVLAIVPAVWRRVMDQRVVDHFGGDVSLANISPRKRETYLRALRRRGPRRRAPRPRRVAAEAAAGRGRRRCWPPAAPAASTSTRSPPATSTRASPPAPPGPTSRPTGAAPTAGCARRSTSCPSSPSGRSPERRRRSRVRRSLDSRPWPETTRDRIVAAAVEMTTSSGWAAVTMARLAEDGRASAGRRSTTRSAPSRRSPRRWCSRSWPASSASSSRPSTPSPTT